MSDPQSILSKSLSEVRSDQPFNRHNLSQVQVVNSHQVIRKHVWICLPIVHMLEGQTDPQKTKCAHGSRDYKVFCACCCKRDRYFGLGRSCYRRAREQNGVSNMNLFVIISSNDLSLVILYVHNTE
jgi:hypothetical protein